MEFYEAVIKRRTVREFSARPVPQDALRRVLAAGLRAPELLVVVYKMKPLGECRTLFKLNPLASVWMCIENVMLAMAAEGLYGCTYTPYDASGLKERLAVPAGYEIAAVIPFGYPRAEPGPGEEIPIDERLHIDRW